MHEYIKEILGLLITTLIDSNGEKDDIMKIIKSLEESGLPIKDVWRTIKTEAKIKKVEFLACY